MSQEYTGKSFVAYYRVSTDKQGKSGLGMEAQAAAVATYVSQTGGRVAAAYTEVESGRVKDRPQLALALAHARRGGSCLVVAKLDRLARNMAFLSALMESKTPFVCCDNPVVGQDCVDFAATVSNSSNVHG